MLQTATIQVWPHNTISILPPQIHVLGPTLLESSKSLRCKIIPKYVCETLSYTASLTIVKIGNRPSI